MLRSILHTSPQRQLLPFFQRTSRIATTSRLTLSTIANESSDSSSYNHTAWMLLSASAAAATITSRTRCEDVVDDKEEEEEDKYDNLPEEDEPTHCSICMTYRQGPCRPYWRKVEACTKDNELKEDKEKGETCDDQNDDEESQKDPPCLKYMLPWIDCATGFRNLYNLIELDTNYTMGISDLEKEATENLCWESTSEPKIDWSSWKRYVQQSGWKHQENKRRNSSSLKGKSLWKTLDQTKDPEVIEIEATVAMIQDSGVLECAYAQDQDGNVIGFAYGRKPSEASVEEEKEGEQTSNVTLKIRLLPTITESVIVAASYTQPKNEGKNDEGKNEEQDDRAPPLESHLYKSRPYLLKNMAKSKKTISNKASFTEEKQIL